MKKIIKMIGVCLVVLLFFTQFGTSFAGSNFPQIYSLNNYALYEGTDSISGQNEVAFIVDLDIQASSTDVHLYKNGLLVTNISGVVGATTIQSYSSNMTDKGDYYSLPAGMYGRLNVMTLWNPSDMDISNSSTSTAIYFIYSPDGFASYIPINIPTIVTPLKITSPNGGEKIMIGSTDKITWSSTGLKSSDTISLSLVDDDIVCPINNSGAVAVGCSSAFGLGNTTNTGSYSWNTNLKMSGDAGPSSIQLGPGAKYKIKICQVGTDICNTSDNYFTISSTQTTSTSTIATSTPVATSTTSTSILPPTPKKPTVKTSSTCGGQVDLTWVQTIGANSYNVYRATSENGSYSVIGKNISGWARYTDTPGQGKFFYKITALNTVGESPFSPSTSATASKQCKPTIPANVTAITGPTCGGQITVVWNPAQNADSYNIFRSNKATGSYKKIASIVTATTTVYTDTSNLMVTTKQTTVVNKKKVTTNVTTPGTFFYKITATNSVGTSAFSPSVSATASSLCAVSLNAPVLPQAQVAQSSFLKSLLGNAWTAFASLFR